MINKIPSTFIIANLTEREKKRIILLFDVSKRIENIKFFSSERRQEISNIAEDYKLSEDAIYKIILFLNQHKK